MYLTAYPIIVTSLYDWLASHPREVLYRACVLFFAATYFFVVLLVRWHLLARFTRNHLQAELEMVRSGLRVRGWREGEGGHSQQAHAPQSPPAADAGGHAPTPLPESATAEQRRAILRTARPLLKEAEGINRGWNLLDFLFWSRGREPLGFSYVKDTERLLWRLRTADEVKEHLGMLAQELRQAGSPGASALAQRIEEAVRKNGSAPGLSALLQETLAACDARNISSFVDSIRWHNKAMWMTTIALLLTTALALTVQSPNPTLFIAGAIGGFLSRMMRMLKQARVGNTSGVYGEDESWVTLFISPLVGALAGWTGVLLIIVTNAGMTGSGVASKELLSQSQYATTPPKTRAF